MRVSGRREVVAVAMRILRSHPVVSAALRLRNDVLVDLVLAGEPLMFELLLAVARFLQDVGHFLCEVLKWRLTFGCGLVKDEEICIHLEAR